MCACDHTPTTVPPTSLLLARSEKKTVRGRAIQPKKKNLFIVVASTPKIYATLCNSGCDPKGRDLEPGVDATGDIDTRADGEEQPQLEVSPITMYVTEYAER